MEPGLPEGCPGCPQGAPTCTPQTPGLAWAPEQALVSAGQRRQQATVPAQAYSHSGVGVRVRCLDHQVLSLCSHNGDKETCLLCPSLGSLVEYLCTVQLDAGEKPAF